MDKLGGKRIVLLLHHADMGVNSKAFHTSPTGHTSEHHQWAGGDTAFALESTMYHIAACSVSFAELCFFFVIYAPDSQRSCNILSCSRSG